MTVSVYVAIAVHIVNYYECIVHAYVSVYHSSINIRAMIFSGSKFVWLLAAADGSGPFGDVSESVASIG